MVISTVWIWHTTCGCHIIQYIPAVLRGKGIPWIHSLLHCCKSEFGTIQSGNWAGQVISEKWEQVCLETLSWKLVWKCVLHEQWLKITCAWWQSVWTLCQVGKLFFKFQIQSDASRTTGLPPCLILQYQNPTSKEIYTKCILPILMP